MPGFGERDRVIHRLALAHLADQDYVRRLPQRIFQGHAPALAVDPDLALRDHAVLVRMHVLDRVLDRDDVALAVLVAIAHHRRQRGGLARSGRAHHHHDPAFGHRQIVDQRGQVQFLGGRNVVRDHPQHDTHLALLHEGRHPEPSDPGRADREIALLGRFEFRRLPVVHDRAHQLGRVLLRQRLVRNRQHPAVHLESGRKIRGQEQVGTLLRQQQLQKVVHEAGCLVPFHSVLRRSRAGVSAREIQPAKLSGVLA